MESIAHLSPQSPLLTAQSLSHTFGDRPLFEGLDIRIGPGLSLVRGGDGRGKTTLLQILAGERAPTSGMVVRPDEPVCLPHPVDPADDAVVARDWLARQQPRYPRWSQDAAERLASSFALGPHLDKPLYMLSAGSRRKLGLVAAAASGAALTCLDMPYAALDAPSGRVLTALLGEAAAQRQRAWIVADHDMPPGWTGLPLAAVIDLGD
jgi:ABC-type multidrug transport system ATPase subunit